MGLMAAPQASSRKASSRAFIQLTLPSRVLISPLWANRRKGWKRFQLGKVFVA